MRGGRGGEWGRGGGEEGEGEEEEEGEQEMRAAILFLALSAVSVALSPARISMGLEAGSPAPKWSATSHKGESFSSDSMAGSKCALICFRILRSNRIDAHFPPADCVFFYPQADTGG